MFYSTDKWNHWFAGTERGDLFLIMLLSTLLPSLVFICTCGLFLNLLTLQCKISSKTTESVKMKERVSSSAVLWRNTETSDESHLPLSTSCVKAYEHNQIVQAHLIHIHLPSCDNSIVPEFCDSVERILGPYLFHLALNTWKSSCMCFSSVYWVINSRAAWVGEGRDPDPAHSSGPDIWSVGWGVLQEAASGIHVQ